MFHKNMTLLKQTTISLITAIFVSFFVYGGYTIYAASNVTFDFREQKDYMSVIDNYHREMNSFFNRKVTALRELTKDDDFLTNPEKRKMFEVPPDIDKKNDDLETVIKKCAKNGNNISTYCVSMEALEVYMEYVRHLGAIKDNLSDLPADSIDDKIRQLAAKNQKIEQEVEDARAVMEATLATYNEFSMAYPMHKKYVMIAKQLVKYKLTLKDIRKRVMLFPIKFIDASTTQCQ